MPFAWSLYVFYVLYGFCMAWIRHTRMPMMNMNEQHDRTHRMCHVNWHFEYIIIIITYLHAYHLLITCITMQCDWHACIMHVLPWWWWWIKPLSLLYLRCAEWMNDMHITTLYSVNANPICMKKYCILAIYAIPDVKIRHTTQPYPRSTLRTICMCTWWWNLSQVASYFHIWEGGKNSGIHQLNPTQPHPTSAQPAAQVLSCSAIRPPIRPAHLFLYHCLSSIYHL